MTAIRRSRPPHRGYARTSNPKLRRINSAQFLNQLSVAHGSVRELETHTMIAGRLEFIAPSTVETILERAAEVGV